MKRSLYFLVGVCSLFTFCGKERLIDHRNKYTGVWSVTYLIEENNLGQITRDSGACLGAFSYDRANDRRREVKFVTEAGDEWQLLVDKDGAIIDCGARVGTFAGKRAFYMQSSSGLICNFFQTTIRTYTVSGTK